MSIWVTRGGNAAEVNFYSLASAARCLGVRAENPSPRGDARGETRSVISPRASPWRVTRESHEKFS